ncbi:MAG: hypothetical protein F4W93_13560 [Dehalococcoidia bacterium]|nr:hypothetical protein [Dehalococcoidia bacterium]
MTEAEKIDRVYSALAECAREQKLISYLCLSTKSGVGSARSIGLQLAYIAGFCAGRKWPHLTSLVVQKGTTRPGSGYVPIGGSLEEDREYVYAFDWSTVSIP